VAARQQSGGSNSQVNITCVADRHRAIGALPVMALIGLLFAMLVPRRAVAPASGSAVR
jgi:hypothetical protein